MVNVRVRAMVWDFGLVKEVGFAGIQICAWEAQLGAKPLVSEHVRGVCNRLYVSMLPMNDLTVCFFQETEIDILATVQNLLRQCVQPSAFLRPLSKLFSIIHNKLPRQALTNVFQVQQRT